MQFPIFLVCGECPGHCWGGKEGGPGSCSESHESVSVRVKQCSKWKSQLTPEVPQRDRGAGGDGRGLGGQTSVPHAHPTPTILQSPRPLRFTFHFCSSSMDVNGHCSVEKDKNVFSSVALFWTFSLWAKGRGWEAFPWQSRPRQGGVVLDVGRAAWVRGWVDCLVCLSVLDVHRESPEGASTAKRAVSLIQLWFPMPSDPSWPPASPSLL